MSKRAQHLVQKAVRLESTNAQRDDVVAAPTWWQRAHVATAASTVGGQELPVAEYLRVRGFVRATNVDLAARLREETLSFEDQLAEAAAHPKSPTRLCSLARLVR